MAATHYDLVVIGSGPAGEKGAAQAAYFGKKVALIERGKHVGGAGINTGTIPSKTLRETALYFSGLLQRGLYGIDYSLKGDVTVADFMHREKVVVEKERKMIRHNIDRHHIELMWGEASLKDAHTVHVHTKDGEDIDLETDFILIATGSSPFRPPEIPFDDHLIFDSDSILRMRFIPKKMAVVGGGTIGAEYASMFTALGVSVTLIEGRDRILGFVDQEIARLLTKQLQEIGLRLLLNTKLLKTERLDHHVQLTLNSGEVLEMDCVLFAAGRQSNVEGLGLEALGVQMGQRGLILVNDKYQTNIANIYAAGDVIGFPALASTSMEQARVAMVHAFKLHYKEQVSPILPAAVYTIPEIAMVGLSEEECQKQNIAYLVGHAEAEDNPRGLIIGDTGMLKLIFAAEDKKLLGVHIICEIAAELVHIGAQVMAANGTIDAFIHTVYNYPSLADMYKYAAYDGLGKWEQAQEKKS